MNNSIKNTFDQALMEQVVRRKKIQQLYQKKKKDEKQLQNDIDQIQQLEEIEKKETQIIIEQYYKLLLEGSISLDSILQEIRLLSERFYQAAFYYAGKTINVKYHIEILTVASTDIKKIENPQRLQNLCICANDAFNNKTGAYIPIQKYL